MRISNKWWRSISDASPKRRSFVYGMLIATIVFSVLSLPAFLAVIDAGTSIYNDYGGPLFIVIGLLFVLVPILVLSAMVGRLAAFLTRSKPKRVCTDKVVWTELFGTRVPNE